MTPIVSKIRELLHRRTGVWFDCVFLNYYKVSRRQLHRIWYAFIKSA